MTSAQNAFQSVAFYILQQNNFHKFYRILFTLGLHFREKQALFFILAKYSSTKWKFSPHLFPSAAYQIHLQQHWSSKLDTIENNKNFLMSSTVRQTDNTHNVIDYMKSKLQFVLTRERCHHQHWGRSNFPRKKDLNLVSKNSRTRVRHWDLCDVNYHFCMSICMCHPMEDVRPVKSISLWFIFAPFYGINIHTILLEFRMRLLARGGGGGVEKSRAT